MPFSCKLLSIHQNHRLIDAFSRLHIFCVSLPISPILALIPASFCSISFLASILLIHRHDELATGGATAAHDYLSAVISPRFKFQGVALTYSLPKASFFWAVLTFFSQWFIIIAHHISSLLAVSCTAVAVSVFLAFQFATSGVQLHRPSFWPLRLWYDRKDEASMV